MKMLTTLTILLSCTIAAAQQPYYRSPIYQQPLYGTRTYQPYIYQPPAVYGSSTRIGNFEYHYFSNGATMQTTRIGQFRYHYITPPTQYKYNYGW